MQQRMYNLHAWKLDRLFLSTQPDTVFFILNVTCDCFWLLVFLRSRSRDTGCVLSMLFSSLFNIKTTDVSFASSETHISHEWNISSVEFFSLNIASMSFILGVSTLNACYVSLSSIFTFLRLHNDTLLDK